MTKSKRGSRLLAKDVYVSNDTRATQLNNNDVIIGTPGAGKTRGYVMPLLVTTDESVIVSDTKGNLYNTYKENLESRGFKVMLLDLMSCSKDSEFYNPMDYISYNRSTRKYSETDIRKLVALICPSIKGDKDPFWIDSAKIVLECLISYVLEATPAYEHHLGTVLKLFKCWDEDIYTELFTELSVTDPDSFSVSKFLNFKGLFKAPTTCSCVRQFVAQALTIFEGNAISRVACKRSSFRFSDIGNRKTAFFINVSDCDRAQDKLLNIFYAQAIQQLIQSADKSEGYRLKVPTRLIFDDFAASTYIADFDQTISVIRSREISVSIILQSISQLESLYGHAKSMTIINCCDHILYLGGTDVDTANYISKKVNKTPYTVLNLDINTCYLFERGDANGPRIVKKACIDDLINNNSINHGKETDIHE